MVTKRTLPSRRNPLLDDESSPSHEELLKRRRLGQTNLAVKPGIAGVSDQSKAEHLGTFDYAHLRVPLPRDLQGSGIFSLKTATTYPESYFLMRRSNDGYISSTGMFKAAFPWASLAEEEAERRYQKTFRSAGREEAGSVWIAPEEALKLADDYGLRRWIVALLDPSPIEVSTKDRHNPNIKTPPVFDINKATPTPATATSAAPVLLPSSSLRSTRARSTRSPSPSKIATPSRKFASPRKSRATRSSAKAGSMNGEEVVEMTATEAVEVTATSSSVLNVIESGSVVTESVASESVEGDKEPNTVRIEVEERVEQHGDVETRNTNVKIDVPADHPELPTLDDPTKMIEEARRMVEEARELEKAAGTGATSSKRKAEDLAAEDAEATEERPAKVARRVETTEQRWKKEKVTRRALVGMGIMAAIGTAFQYFA